ncbi:MAG: flagellar basal body L-ring protein FlgH [Neptuniibacter sp.]
MNVNDQDFHQRNLAHSGEHMQQSSVVKNLDNYPSLVSDHKAYKTGQNVTVLIMEEASSVTSADTRSSKSLGLSGEVSVNEDSDQASLGLENNAQGQGQISREGRLVASVSATVQQVLANGEMVIYGEQLIEFNDEVQYIQVSGRIRPEDIGSSNTIISSRIANAVITYKGDGLLGQRQKPGVVTRAVNWLF